MQFLDGTDAIMLSEETTLGSFPVEAVAVMTRVANQVQNEFNDRHEIFGAELGMEVVDSVTRSAVEVADEVGAKLIFALTETGFSARMVSRYRPAQKILALSPNVRTCQKLTLSFGCHPVEIKRFTTLKEAFEVVRAYTLKNKLASKGDRVVLVAGAPFNKKGVQTNTLTVETI
jgi:pyruvate kinase